MTINGNERNGQTITIFDLDRTLTRQGTWTAFLIFTPGGRPTRWFGTPCFLSAAVAWILARAAQR